MTGVQTCALPIYEEPHISEDARPVATPVASDDDETLAPGIGHVFECKV